MAGGGYGAQEYFKRAHARPDEDVEGKIADYTEAIRLNPEYADAFFNRGVARGDMFDAAGAIADSPRPSVSTPATPSRSSTAVSPAA